MSLWLKVGEGTELRLLEEGQAGELFDLIDSNREHLRVWLPWVDLMRGEAEVGKAMAIWQRQRTENRGLHAGVWHRERLCGVINHLNVDWQNRCAFVSYWLDAGEQGRGLMTACCRTFIGHGLGEWKLNRVTIECATENKRSRAIPERLGFRLEGVTRSSEWLHDRFVDHAIYGMLRGEFEGGGEGQGREDRVDT